MTNDKCKMTNDEGRMTKEKLPTAKSAKAQIPRAKGKLPIIRNHQSAIPAATLAIKKLFDSVSTHRTGGILPQVEGRGFADRPGLDIISLQTSLMF
jgi:hypothetical protein